MDENLNKPLLQDAARDARGLAMDAVSAAKSGHLGLPLGAAEMGAVLFGHALNINPDEPRWMNRDRFVLSAGHGSMFLYAWLHLAGFKLPLEEIKNFRQLHSHTPGHPEFGETPGVECTTGPLGQGIGNAVGIAMSVKMAAAHYNTPEHTIFDSHVVVLAGDGCMQEGISSEASALAGHWGLDNLILFYDSNDVTLDAQGPKSQSENTAERFRAYGFDVDTIPGHDMDAILAAFELAKANDNGRPKLIIAKTIIGKGIPEVEGTFKAHGEAGVKFVEADRKLLGLPDERFYVSPAVRTYFSEHKSRLTNRYNSWLKTFEAWKSTNPDKFRTLDNAINKRLPENLLSLIPEFPADKKIATRSAGGEAMQPLAQAIPNLISGSADLHGSTKNYLKDMGDFSRDCRTGRNIYWGIREHAMGATMNGLSYDGLWRPSGATFLTFSDYMRPSVRLAALAHLSNIFIWTHDSVAVGEDGPTHEPVETVSSLRLIPNLDVIRPADAEETAGAWVAALERTSGPTALILSRQDLPVLSSVPVKTRREGVFAGGYIAKMETEALQCIILATGSEMSIAMEAANTLGASTRVVSMPCIERFNRQSPAYRDQVLPPSCTKRIAVEAGATALWYKYVGSQGKVIGIDRFGLSAPGDAVLRELGITAEHIVEETKEC
ncbi:MAG: transketolase [Verrucomicrobia bacterium 21-51-4]|nr:MAG: transketolase [Verrucomicrobia bacterium 21-51-4]HQU09133.1 transketolase [Opitutales bacterium]